FLPKGDIVVPDEGCTGFVPDVVEVNPATRGQDPDPEGRRRDRDQVAVRHIPGRRELRSAPAPDPGPAARCGRRRRERSAVEPVTVVMPARNITRAGCRAGGGRCRRGRGGTAAAVPGHG